MNILFVTNQENNNLDIPKYLTNLKENVEIIKKKFSLELIKKKKIDFIITYKSRFLIKEEIINYINKNIINIHGSYLPWCRGYYSNFWSTYFNLPNGVTIHYIDQNIDSGDILAQKMINYNLNDTLKSTYNKLDKLSIKLFKKCWIKIKEKKIKCMNQKNFNFESLNKKIFNKNAIKYAYKIFYKKDFENIFDMLPHGWNTKIKDIRKININI